MFHDPKGKKWALFDYDDCAVDYISGLSEFLERTMGLKTKGRPSSWNMSEWSGLTAEEMTRQIIMFNETDEGFARLAPLPGAVKAFRTLRALGFDIGIATSSSVKPESVERRTRNILTNFPGMVDRLHIVPLGETKEHVLSSYPLGVWVEDNPKNAVMGSKIGHKTFLMHANHNAGVRDDIKREHGIENVSGWDELIPMIGALVVDPKLHANVSERDAQLCRWVSDNFASGVMSSRGEATRLVAEPLISAGLAEESGGVMRLTQLGKIMSDWEIRSGAAPQRLSDLVSSDVSPSA